MSPVITCGPNTAGIGGSGGVNGSTITTTPLNSNVSDDCLWRGEVTPNRTAFRLGEIVDYIHDEVKRSLEDDD